MSCPKCDGSQWTGDPEMIALLARKGALREANGVMDGEPCCEPCDVCPDGFIEDWDTGRTDPCPTCNGTMRKTTTDQEAE